ncbi:MAG: hypothetical protein QNK18_19705 [Gammaproteobacteria bacterium]|nr:hypothetical protein [Gammaproteobacteria bacterium]
MRNRRPKRAAPNYNHMHAMTVQYYEVVQVYKVVTRVEKCERVLFLPLKPITFFAPVVARYKDILTRAALTPSIRRLLEEWHNEFTWDLVPTFLWDNLDYELKRIESKSKDAIAKLKETLATAASAAKNDVKKKKLEDKADQEERAFVKKTAKEKLDLRDQANKLETAYRTNIDDVRDTLLLPRLQGDATNRRLSLPGDMHIKRIAIDLISLPFSLILTRSNAGKTEMPHEGGIIEINETVFNLHKLALKLPQSESLPRTCRVTVTFLNPLAEDEADLAYDISLAGYKNGKPITLFAVSSPTAKERGSRRLMNHLNHNKLHYSQAVWPALPPSYFSQLFSRIGAKSGDDDALHSLADSVDPQPIAATGNYLGFIWHFDKSEKKLAHEFATKHVRTNGDVEDTIPLASGGVFAEAVLGRYNCAEKIDGTRFFNWQDSVPPVLPPNIADVGIGSRQGQQTLAVDKLDESVVQLQMPATLPESNGLKDIIGALKNEQLFRDLSGQQQTIQALEAAGKLTSEQAEKAAQNATTNMKHAIDLQGQFITAMQPVLKGYGQALGKDSMTEHVAKKMFGAKQAKASTVSTPVQSEPPGGATRPGVDKSNGKKKGGSDEGDENKSGLKKHSDGTIEITKI